MLAVLTSKRLETTMHGKARIHFVQLFLHGLSLSDHEVRLHLVSSVCLRAESAVRASGPSKNGSDGQKTYELPI